MQNFSRPVNLLLIEDNPGDVVLTQEAFRDARIEVDIKVVMDGEEAVKYLNQEAPYTDAIRPDMVLLDLNIPKKDGREVLAHIRSTDKLKTLPVVMLTTSNAELDIMRIYDLNVNAYIKKPVDFDKFFEIVQKIEEFWLMTAILPTSIQAA